MYRAIGVALNDAAVMNGTMPLYGLVLLNETNYKADVVSVKELVTTLCNNRSDIQIRNVSWTQEAIAAIKQGTVAFDKYLQSGNTPFKISDMAFDLLPRYSVSGRYLESALSLVILAEINSDYLVVDNKFKTTFITQNTAVELLKRSSNFIRNAYLKQGDVLVLKDRNSVPHITADTAGSKSATALNGIPRLSSTQGNDCSLPLVIDEASRPFCVSIKGLHNQNAMNVMFIEDRNNANFIPALLNNANEAFNRVPGAHVTTLMGGYKLSEGSRALRSLLTMKIVFLPKQTGHSLVNKVEKLLKNNVYHNVITQFAEYCNVIIADYENPHGIYLKYNPSTPAEPEIIHLRHLQFNTHKAPIMTANRRDAYDIDEIVTPLVFGTLHEFADEYNSDEIIKLSTVEYRKKLRVKDEKLFADYAAELCGLSMLILDKYALPLLEHPFFNTDGDTTVPADLITHLDNMRSNVRRLVVLINAFYLAVRDNVYGMLDLCNMLHKPDFDFEHSCAAYIHCQGLPETYAAKLVGNKFLWFSPYEITNILGKYWGYWKTY